MKNILLTICLCVFGFASYAQDNVVKGKILDSSGLPLPGVNIIVEGTTNGTSTNFDGNYELKCAMGDALVISFMGFKTQTITVASWTVNCTLEDDTELLDELIVVGYGVQKKSNMTGSVTNIKADDLKTVTTPNIANMLQGKAAGVYVSANSGRPGAAPRIRIRGKSTLSGSVDPLWVVDGVIQAEAPDLNAQDIESTTILKDASATALYGSRAANGVVLVTTRSAQADQSKISISVKTGVSDLSLGNFSMMNAAEMTDYIKSFGNGYADLDWFTEDAQNVDTDWFDEGTKLGVVQDYGISFSGGNDKMKTYISGNVYDESGAVKGYDYTRYSGRMNVDYKIRDYLTLHPKMSFTYKDIQDKQQGVSEMFLNMPYDRPKDDNGNIINPKDETVGWIGRDRSNSIYDLQWNYSESTTLKLSPSLGFDVKIAPGLSFVSSNSFDYQHYNSMSYTDPQSSSGQNDGGSISNYHWKSMNQFSNQLLRFTKSIDEHFFTVMAAYEYNNYEWSTTKAQKNGIVSGTSILDAGAEMKNIEGSKDHYAFKSYLFNANYSYSSRYMAQFSFRRDGSSKFGEDTRFGNFYSISGGWNIHNEDFFDIKEINVLKLRASYGVLGNTPGDYTVNNKSNYHPSKELYSITNQYNGVPVISANQLGNDDLTWEKTYSTNFAVDLRIFDRFDINMEYYIKDTKDLLYYVSLPATSGFNGYWENIGAVKNKGVEFLIGADIFKAKDNNFAWHIDANVGFNTNEVQELYENKEFTSGNKIRREGEDMDTWYMRKWAGVNSEDGKPQWEVIGEDGTTSLTSNYNDATNQIVGSSSPDFFGGLSSVMSYKNFSLNMNLDFVSGIDIYNSSRELYDNDGAYASFNSMSLKSGWSRWTKPGDIATHPQALNGGNSLSNKTSSRYLENGSFLKLRNVTLNYSFAGFKEKSLLNNLSVYVSAENLLTITDFSGIDPEVGNENSEGETSQYGDYAIPRRFMFGFNFSF
ncbi:TonB-dependent receptor [Labilibaculum sp. K2S]|uniref:SusC/RagA family TonB-linked outer membrane protein n=1 Tax=Labilibaculum sp. K2S TaxID=3056386 RepID=UPI0025A32048|nr:TonB-dependent receptor [Labilibaculum sp. K2S]MDM8162031.1 TonB-dependent receptor [Labilibaculum sp. K2S]